MYESSFVVHIRQIVSAFPEISIFVNKTRM